MSLRLLPASLNVLRGIAAVAVVFAAAAAYSPESYRYHSFFAGATLGILLVLTLLLFRAHPAEVEALPPDTLTTDTEKPTHPQE